jgi:Tol biopolymer transport system component
MLAATGGSGRSSPAVFTGAVVFERDPGSSSDIYVATSPGQAAPVVSTPAQEFDPALAADGRVAFARATGQTSEIYILSHGQETQATKDGAVDQHPAWSPKGDRIAYSRDKGKGADIVEVKVGDPSSARPVFPAPGDDFTPAYAPDGRLAFASSRSGNFELYLVDANRKLVQLTRDPDTELSPSWSPDGAQIAYTRVDQTGNADIWILRVATRKAVRITTDPADDSDPSFSPDGQQLAFVSDRSGGVPTIWTMAAKRGAPATPLAGIGAGVELGPGWGPTPPPKKLGRAPAGTTISITCPSSGPYAGTAGNDTINGTAADDTICGQGGNDAVRGWGGHDTLSGGFGTDLVNGGTANDPIVSGGPGGGDKILGDYGDDKLFGRDGAVDTLSGGPGFDRCQYDYTSTVKDFRSCEATIP